MGLALRVERASSVRRNKGPAAKSAVAPVVSGMRAELGFTTKCQYQNIDPRNETMPFRAAMARCLKVRC
jgi:hypothetical protein